MSSLSPIPDWLVDAIAAKGIREREFANDMPELDEDFDFDGFRDWIPANLGDEDGSWYAFEECPVAGRRHKGQGVRGCALYYDGGKLGFKCHAAECPSNIDRKPGQSGISYLLSFLSQEHGAYPGVIWPQQTTEDLLEEFGAVEIEEIAGVLPMAIPVSAVAKIVIPITEKKPGERAFAKGGLDPADYRPGTVVPCEICGKGCSSEAGGGSGRCAEHTEAALALKQSEAPAAVSCEAAAASVASGGEEDILVGTKKGDNVYVSVTHMHLIDGEPYEWLWDQRLLRNALNFFAGKPERCKSLGALEVAAVVSTGKDWPDGRKNTLGPRTVLVMMSEDSVKKAIWGRLKNAGADMSRIKAVTGVIVGDEMRLKKKKRAVALAKDLSTITALIKKFPTRRW